MFQNLSDLTASSRLGLIDGNSANSLARIGLGGLTLNQTNRYFSPKENSKILLAAAQRQYCIMSAGRPSIDETDPAKYGIIADGLTKVRILLRQELTRGEFPDYTTLVADYAAALKTPSGERVELTASPQTVDQLKLAVAACFVKKT